MAQIVKLSRNGNSYTAAIPRGQLLQLGWRAGEVLASSVVNGRLVYSSMRVELDRIEAGNGDAAAVVERGAHV